MQNTLQLISIQHELGMAIGLDLRLKPMLQHFTKVCIRRLGLAGVHFFFFNNESGELVLGGTSERKKICHYFSLPDSDWEDILNNKDRMKVFQESCVKEREFFACEEREGEFIYYFGLDGFGIAVFRQFTQPIHPSIQLLLKPIFDRLTISCRASIEHEQLLQAISARQKAEETIVFQLHHDDLTRLPNRRLLMERLAQEISRCNRHYHFGALLFLDLDRFKAVNDTLGHSVGDLLLKAVGTILKKMIRREDMVARLGRDEFVILLTELGDTSERAVGKVRTVVEKIRDMFSKPLVAGDHTLHVTLSIGIEIFQKTQNNAEDILRHADIAMYQAKVIGRNASLFYDSKMSKELADRLSLEKELREAIKNGEFELYYQPQCLFTGDIMGAEVLLRWNNPGRGLVSPAQFIPIAEETGLILEIGRWVFHRVCHQLRSLEEVGLPPEFKKVLVNVSSIELSQFNFIENIRYILGETRINPHHLGIELTEGTLIRHIDDTVKKMRALRKLGIHISIDDFGTGYSSLSYLNRFPIETLKIDQTFVRSLHLKEENRAIVETLMALGKGLGLSIIAEGVETKEELDCLRSFGCEQFQGFYFARPIPFTQFQKLVIP